MPATKTCVRRATRCVALVLTLVLGLSAPSAAAPRQDGPVWTQPQPLASDRLAPGFPGAVAVSENGRALIVFGCTRGRDGDERRKLCARWRERSGKMGIAVTLGDAPAGPEDALVEAAVSRNGFATVVWQNDRGLQMKRVRSGGRLGVGAMLTTDRARTLDVTAGDVGSVAVAWSPGDADDAARVRVVEASGRPTEVAELPGNSVHRLVNISGEGGLGYAVLTSDAWPDRSVARYDLTEIAEDATVRATAVVDEAMTAADLATRHTGALVVVWWRLIGDEQVLMERRYPDGAAGASHTRRLGSAQDVGGEVVLVSTLDGDLHLVSSTDGHRRVAVVPWSRSTPLRHRRLEAAGRPYSAFGRIVFLHPVASTVGQYISAQTWNGTRVSRAKHVLVDDRFDNECGDSRFDVASTNGHIAVVNVRELGCVRRGLVRAEVVFRDRD